jgi:hypothetical protein
MKHKKSIAWLASAVLLVSLWFVPAVRSQVISSAGGLFDPNGNLLVALGTLIAGERQQGSATLSYLVVRQEANATVISTTGAVTLGGGAANDTHLLGLQIHTALTGTCVVAGFQDEALGAKSYTFPAASVGFKDFFGAINAAGALTVTCSNAADDDRVIALWRPR